MNPFNHHQNQNASLPPPPPDPSSGITASQGSSGFPPPPPPEPSSGVTFSQWNGGFPPPSNPTPLFPGSSVAAPVNSPARIISQPGVGNATTTAQLVFPPAFPPEASNDHHHGFAGNAGFGAEEECDREFPLDCLPIAMRQIAEEVSRSTLAPVSLSAACVLGTVSAALGAGVEIATGGGESLRGNLFIMAAAESGTGKSRAFNAVVAPLKEFERDLLMSWNDNHKPSLAAELLVLEQELNMRQKSGKGGKAQLDRDNLIKEIARLNKNIEVTKKKLVEPRLIVSDATKEALAIKLAHGKNEALASMNGEARGCIDVLCGRYNSMTDESLYLAGYTGDQLTIDRVNREQVLLQRPCLSLLWLFQPDKIDQLTGTEAFTAGGLMPRCLIFNSRARPQEEPVIRHPIPKIVSEMWRNLVVKLAENFHHRDIPVTIQTAPEAAELFREYHNMIVQRRNDGDLNDVNSYAARWAENAWRIALVLHAGSYAESAINHELNADIARAAIAIMNWFADRQLQILSGAREQKRTERGTKLFNLLAGKPGMACTLRDLVRRNSYERGEIEAIVRDHPDQISIIKLQAVNGGRPTEIVRLITADPR